MSENNVFSDLLTKLQESMVSMDAEQAAQLLRGGEVKAMEEVSGEVALPVSEGELYSLPELLEAHFEDASHDALFLIRDGDDLKVRLADNDEFILKDFFVVCVDGQCAIELSGEEGKEGIIIDGDAEGEMALEDGTTLLGYSGDPEAVMAMLQMDPVLAPFVDALSIEGLADSQAPMAVGQLGEVSPEEYLSQEEGSGDDSGLSWGMVAGMLGGVGLAAAAASGGSSSSNETSGDPADPQDPAVTTEFDVGTMLGPAISGNDLYVAIYDAGGNRLAEDVKLADNGLAHVVIEGEYNGPVLLRLFDSDDSQPDYMDEATQISRDLADSLNSVVLLDSTVETVYITPLTDLATRYMGSDLSDADAIVAANAAVGRLFGQQADLLSEEPIPVVDTDGNVDLTASNLYGQMLALMSKVEASNSLSVHELLDQLKASLEYDGQQLSWKDEEAGWVAQQMLFEAVELASDDGIIDKQAEIEQLFVLADADDHVVTIRRHGDTPRDAVAPSGADVQIAEISDELRFTLSVRTPDGAEVNLEEFYESGPQSDITEATHADLFNHIAADLALDNLTLTSINLSQGASGKMTLTVTPMVGIVNDTASLSVVGEGLASNTYGMRVLSVSQLGADEVASLTKPVFDMIDAGPGLGLLNRDAVREGLTSEQYEALDTAQQDSLPKPATPTLSFIDTGDSDSDAVTNNGSISVSGIEEGNGWEYTTDGVDWQAGSGGGFILEQGMYDVSQIQVRQNDTSGLPSETIILSDIVSYPTLTIDTTAPEVVINDIGNEGVLNAQDIATPYSVEIQAAGAEGQVLTLEVGEVGFSHSVEPSGVWSSTIDFSVLGEGEHVITATTTDVAGNQTVVESTITIDTTPPMVSIDTLADDNVLNAVAAAEGLTVSGMTDAENGQVVTVTLDAQEYTANVENGTWSLVVEAAMLAELDNTDYTVTAKVSDAAGNVSEVDEQILTVNVTAPEFATSAIELVPGASGPSGWHIEGDTVTIGVNFTDAVQVNGVPILTLMLDDGATRQAQFTGLENNDTTLMFDYTIQQGDNATFGISLAEGALSLPEGSSILDLAGNPLVAPSPAVEADSSTQVDAVQPTIESIQLSAVDGTGAVIGDGDVLSTGDAILVEVGFSEAISADVSAQASTIFIEVNGQTLEASFDSVDGQTAIYRHDLSTMPGISGNDVSVVLADAALELGSGQFLDHIGNPADVDINAANPEHTPQLSVDIDVDPLMLATDQLLADVANLDVRSDLLIALDSAAEFGTTGSITLQAVDGSTQTITWADPLELAGVLEMVSQGGNHYLKITPEHDLDFDASYTLTIGDGSLVKANNGLSFGAEQTLNFATVAPSTDAGTPGTYSSTIELADDDFALVADNARWSLVDGQGNNDDGGVPTLVSHTASEDIDMYVLSADDYDAGNDDWLFSGTFVSIDNFDNLADKFYFDLPNPEGSSGIDILDQVGNPLDADNIEGVDPRQAYSEVIGVSNLDDEFWGFTLYNSNALSNFESVIIFNGQSLPAGMADSISNSAVIG